MFVPERGIVNTSFNFWFGY